MKFRPKRILFLAHRWLGVAMCLFFAVWFATGVVMMYVEYPELTEAERLHHLPVLDPSGIRLDPAVAVRSAGQRCGLDTLTMSATGSRPAYHLVSRCGERASIFADTGNRIDDGVTEALALATVRASGFAAAGDLLKYDGAIEMDQWTVSEILEPHRPLHRVAVANSDGTVLYVSSTTGQIVRDTDQAERFWNWLGSTLHWIYPYQLRRHRLAWENLVICVSLAGIVSVVTGAVIGFMRFRPWRRYPRRGASPYRGMDRWHHLLGLAFLLFVSTFIFSGLLSMSPWGIFAPSEPAAEQIERFTGGALRDFWRFPDPRDVLVEPDVREIDWRQIAGEGHLVLRGSNDRRMSVARDQFAESGYREPLLNTRIVGAAPALLPDASIAALDVLLEHDDYYYTRHNRYRPLPVFRVEFDDPSATWYYIDLATGAVIQRHTSKTRIERWLYNGLHSLDFSFLTRRGFVWDLTVIALSLAGFAFAVTSVVIGWRRLRML